jgi:hypothetical protein
VTTGFVIHAGDGYGWHTEVLKGVTACGRAFDLGDEDVTREPFDPPSADDPHATCCFDCFGTPRMTPEKVRGGGA